MKHESKTATFVNLTKFKIVLIASNGETFTYPPNGFIALRKSLEYEMDWFNDNIPVFMIDSKCECDLPEPIDGVFYIVPGRILKISNRKDLVAPDISKHSAIYDKQGKIIAIKRFYGKRY